MTSGVFVGLSTVDLIYAVDEFPSPNSKAVARTQDVLIGGPATNASITFSHLGGNATLVTAVGRHTLSDLIRHEAQQYSVRLLDLHPDLEDVPVISSIAVNRSGERNIISANATRLTIPPAHPDDRALDESSILLVDGHYMPACQAWAGAARAKGKPVVLDGGSWKSGTEELLPSVDTAICSADFRPSGSSTSHDVLTYLKNSGVRNVAITRGAEPIIFLSGDNSGTVQVPHTAVVDTMGAGDIFHGAFCYYAAIGLNFTESLDAAAKIASASCSFRGTREWMMHHPRPSNSRAPNPGS